MNNMEEPPLTEEGQLEIVKYQVNKMVKLGIYTPPPGWEPFAISEDVQERIEKAKKS